MLYLASLAAAAFLIYSAERNPVGLWVADRIDDTVAFATGFGFSGPARMVSAVVVPLLIFSLLYAWVDGWIFGFVGATVVFATVCAGARFDLARRLIDDIQIDWLRGDATAAEIRLEKALESWVPAVEGESLARRLSFLEKALLLAVVVVFSGAFYFILLGPVGVVLYLLAVFYHQRCERDEPNGVLAALLWLPSRALATTFLLVGDFSAGAKAVGNAWMDHRMPVHTALTNAALACSPNLADLDSFGEKAKLLAGFSALTDLLRRSAVVWLVVFSLWVLLL